MKASPKPFSQVPESPAVGAEPWTPRSDEVLFRDEAWLREGAGGLWRVGVPLSWREAAAVRSIRLPRVGELVDAGLPLCALELEGEPPRRCAAPLGGEVAAVNAELVARPTLAASDPCGAGWLAAIRPSALADDLRACRQRAVVLASRNELRARRIGGELARVGCRAVGAAGPARALEQLCSADTRVLLVDAPSLADAGPELVRAVLRELAEVRAVVIGEPRAQHEAEYRKAGIFYHAADAFADGEIVEILEAAFLLPPATRRPRRALVVPGWVRRIEVTSRRGERIALLAARGALQEGSGVGRELLGLLRERACPVQITLGHGELAPIDVAEAAAANDRVLLLLAEAAGGLPGQLRRGGHPELAAPAGGGARRVTVIAVEPAAGSGSLEELDPRTACALAEHIARALQ